MGVSEGWERGLDWDEEGLRYGLCVGECGVGELLRF